MYVLLVSKNNNNNNNIFHIEHKIIMVTLRKIIFINFNEFNKMYIFIETVNGCKSINY